MMIALSSQVEISLLMWKGDQRAASSIFKLSLSVCSSREVESVIALEGGDSLGAKLFYSVKCKKHAITDNSSIQNQEKKATILDHEELNKCKEYQEFNDQEDSSEFSVKPISSVDALAVDSSTKRMLDKNNKVGNKFNNIIRNSVSPKPDTKGSSLYAIMKQSQHQPRIQDPPTPQTQQIGISQKQDNKIPQSYQNPKQQDEEELKQDLKLKEKQSKVKEKPTPVEEFGKNEDKKKITTTNKPKIISINKKSQIQSEIKQDKAKNSNNSTQESSSKQSTLIEQSNNNLKVNSNANNPSLEQEVNKFPSQNSNNQQGDKSSNTLFATPAQKGIKKAANHEYRSKSPHLESGSVFLTPRTKTPTPTPKPISYSQKTSQSSSGQSFISDQSSFNKIDDLSSISKITNQTTDGKNSHQSSKYVPGLIISPEMKKKFQQLSNHEEKSEIKQQQEIERVQQEEMKYDIQRKYNNINDDQIKQANGSVTDRHVYGKNAEKNRNEDIQSLKKKELREIKKIEAMIQKLKSERDNEDSQKSTQEGHGMRDNGEKYSSRSHQEREEDMSEIEESIGSSNHHGKHVTQKLQDIIESKEFELIEVKEALKRAEFDLLDQRKQYKQKEDILEKKSKDVEQFHQELVQKHKELQQKEKARDTYYSNENNTKEVIFLKGQLENIQQESETNKANWNQYQLQYQDEKQTLTNLLQEQQDKLDNTQQRLEMMQQALSLSSQEKQLLNNQISLMKKQNDDLQSQLQTSSDQYFQSLNQLQQENNILVNQVRSAMSLMSASNQKKQYSIIQSEKVKDEEFNDENNQNKDQTIIENEINHQRFISQGRQQEGQLDLYKSKLIEAELHLEGKQQQVIELENILKEQKQINDQMQSTIEAQILKENTLTIAYQQLKKELHDIRQGQQKINEQLISNNQTFGNLNISHIGSAHKPNHNTSDNQQNCPNPMPFFPSNVSPFPQNNQDCPNPLPFMNGVTNHNPASFSEYLNPHPQNFFQNVKLCTSITQQSPNQGQQTQNNYISNPLQEVQEESPNSFQQQKLEIKQATSFIYPKQGADQNENQITKPPKEQVDKKEDNKKVEEQSIKIIQEQLILKQQELDKLLNLYNHYQQKSQKLEEINQQLEQNLLQTKQDFCEVLNAAFSIKRNELVDIMEQNVSFKEHQITASEFI